MQHVTPQEEFHCTFCCHIIFTANIMFSGKPPSICPGITHITLESWRAIPMQWLKELQGTVPRSKYFVLYQKKKKKV
jgi:hypothetical protein